MTKYPKSFIDYYGIHDNKWLSQIEETVKQICLKESFFQTGIIGDCRFGLVLTGKQHDQKRVLKIVNPTIKKYVFEIKAAINLPYSFMNKVYSFSIDDGYYIMDYCQKIKRSNQQSWFSILSPVFRSVLEEKQKEFIEADKYERKLLSIEKSISFNNDSLQFHYINACALYALVFGNDKQFYLHGDLHEKNILMKDHLVAIDPIGINAPIEFEFTRFIENQIFAMTSQESFLKETLVLLYDFEKIGLNKDKLCIAVYIDSVMRTCRSVELGDPDHIIQQGIENANWLACIIDEGMCCV